MSFVKICGITNLEDALHCVEAGADALGFVFYEKSPRYIAPKIAQKIIAKLPPFLCKVGLFVNDDANSINHIANTCKLSLLQLHFNAPNSLKKALFTPYLSVKRVKQKKDLLELEEKYNLIDAYVPEFGGMGKRIDTSWFEGVDCSKLILAGGLDAKNISGLKKYKFYGYDVSSGVEKEKGLKDKNKVKAFIKEAKNETI